MKTGIYVYPRFVVSVLALLIALAFFGIVSVVTGLYTASIKTQGPETSAAAQAEYDLRMRTGVRPLTPML